MFQALLLLFSFRCVALFNAWNSIQHFLMIRINADEHFAFAQCRLCVVPLAIGKQRCERRLKKIFLSTSQKYHSILIVREQQIYGIDQYMWEQNRYFANP
jgi:hypothetical protein